jgi:outer membrane protein insertion porin family
MKKIFINFNVFEGDKYTISDAEVIGDVPLEEEIYSQIINSLKDQTYSQAQITSIEEFF